MSDSKKTITIEIKDRWTNRVLYAAEIDPDVAECWRTREAVEQAVKVGAWLDGANLTGANLDGANLAGARLAGARLVGAWLAGANLVGDLKLVGDRPILQLGPLGSRSGYLVVYRTDKGLRVRAGCFFGDVITFLGLVATTHGNGQHARDYRAAVAFAAGVLGVGENPAKPRRSRKPAAKPTKKKAVKK